MPAIRQTYFNDSVLQFLHDIVLDLKFTPKAFDRIACAEVIILLTNHRKFDDAMKLYDWACTQHQHMITPPIASSAIRTAMMSGAGLEKCLDIYRDGLQLVRHDFPVALCEFNDQIPNRDRIFRHRSLSTMVSHLGAMSQAWCAVGDWHNAILSLDTCVNFDPELKHNRRSYEDPLLRAANFQRLRGSNSLSYTLPHILMRCGLRPNLVASITVLGIWLPMLPGTAGQLDSRSLSYVIHTLQAMAGSRATWAESMPILSWLGIYLITLMERLRHGPASGSKVEDFRGLLRLLWHEREKDPQSGLKTTLVFWLRACSVLRSRPMYNFIWNEFYSSAIDCGEETMGITMLQAAGVFRDPDVLKDAWEMHNNARGGLSTITIYKHFVEAAIECGCEQFAIKEIRKLVVCHKLDLSRAQILPWSWLSDGTSDETSDIHNQRSEDLEAGKYHAPPSNNGDGVQEEQLFSDETIDAIMEQAVRICQLYCDDQYHDFYRHPFPVFMEPPKLVAVDEVWLQVYNELRKDFKPPGVRYLDKDTVLRTPRSTAEIPDSVDVLKTGWPVDELRFYNWKDITLLLLDFEMGDNPTSKLTRLVNSLKPDEELTVQELKSLVIRIRRIEKPQGHTKESNAPRRNSS